MTVFVVVLLALLFAADQTAKSLTLSHFAPYVEKWLQTGVTPNVPVGDQVPGVPGLFHFTFRANTGGGFSLLSRHTWLLVAVTLVFFVFAVLAVRKGWLTTKGQKWSLAVICGGALGNLFDRVVRGYVVDMIELEFLQFPVFNVADCFITCGMIALVLFVLLEKRHDPEK